MIAQSNTNHQDETLLIDIEVFVIIGAIPWFLILPVCAGIFLLWKSQKSIAGDCCCCTKHAGLQNDSQMSERSPLVVEPMLLHTEYTVLNSFFAHSQSQSNQTKQFCCERWGFFLAMVIVSTAYALSTGADYYTSYKEFTNKTRMAYPWYRTRTSCRIIAYTANPFLLVPVLIYLLIIYRHIVVKTDELRKKFVNSNYDIRTDVVQIIESSENSFFSKEIVQEKIEVTRANTFATIYLLCGLIWSLGTVYYVFKTKSSVSDELGLYLKCFAHLLSYTTLILFMWRTNSAIDEMKEILIMRMSLNLLKKKEPTTEIVALKVVLKQIDPYAKIFTMKPSMPGILITVVSTAAPILAPFIRKQLFGDL